MKVLQAVKFVFHQTFEACKKRFILYLFLTFLLSLLTIVNFLFFKITIDAVTSQKLLFGLPLMSIIEIWFGYQILYNLIVKFAEYLWNIIDLRQAIYNTKCFTEKLSTLDLSNFESSETYDKIWRSFNRIAWQLRFYLDASIKFLGKCIELSVSIAIFAIASPFNAALIVVANLIPIIIKTKIGNQTFNIYKADSETRRKYEYTVGLVTIHENLVEIKQFQGFGFVKQKLLSLYDLFSKKQEAIFKKAWILLTFVELLPIFAIFIFLFNIIRDLESAKITTGTFVFLFTNIFLFSSALNQLAGHLATLLSDYPFIHDAIDYYNIKNNIIFPKLNTVDKTNLLEKLRNPEISIENVSFSYPNSKAPALSNITFKIPYGQNIALIGENGAGKTTLVKLLLRIYDPSEGKITINGVNLKEIPEDIIFEIYSTLFQTFGKYYLTIRENMELAAGKKLKDEEYVKALELSNAWNFVKDFPKKLDTQLGPNYTEGVDLSGGQWQELAIGKALLRKAPILILDEPTSAVDAKSEMEIFDRLIQKTKLDTLIFISHRFSTIRDAERIVVIDNGKIIEDGTHEVLMQNGKKYAELYTIQAERYDRKNRRA